MSEMKRFFVASVLGLIPTVALIACATVSAPIPIATAEPTVAVVSPMPTPPFTPIPTLVPPTPTPKATPKSELPARPTPTLTPIPTDWQIYRDYKFGLEVKYPPDLTLKTSNQIAAILVAYRDSVSPVFSVGKRNPSPNPGPNSRIWTGRYFLVRAIPNISTSQECFTRGDDGTPLTQQRSINDEVFYYSEKSTTVSPGKRYTRQEHKIFKNNVCFEVDFFHVETAWLHDPTDYAIAKVDKEEAFEILDQILGTFRFIDPSQIDQDVFSTDIPDIFALIGDGEYRGARYNNYILQQVRKRVEQGEFSWFKDPLEVSKRYGNQFGISDRANYSIAKEIEYRHSFALFSSTVSATDGSKSYVIHLSSEPDSGNPTIWVIDYVEREREKQYYGFPPPP